MLDPKGRVVMLSGATRGIGLALAKALLEKGYSLSLGIRRPEAMAGLLPEASPPQRLTTHLYDATDADAPGRWVAETLEQHGHIDALINNAGIYRGVRLIDDDETALDELWEVNVKGPLRMIRAAWPQLQAAGSGRVINLASLSGKRVTGDAVGYSMSKFAVVALTHQLRRDGWESGIRATAICPSFVRSDMAESITSVPPEAMTQPEDLAELVTTILALPNTASVAELTINWNYEIHH
jgi:NADP-dependent 3-hydroxy acid dehydrogenase YdfG